MNRVHQAKVQSWRNSD